MEGVLGVLAGLGSTTIWAYSLVLFERGLTAYGAFTCNLFKACVGAALFWLVVVAGGTDGDFGFGGGFALAMLVVSGMVGMAFGDYAYFACIGHLGVRQAALIQGTGPVFLLAWSAANPHERLGPNQLLGVLLVVTGVSAVTWMQRSRRGEGRGRPLRGFAWGIGAALGQAGGILLTDQALEEFDLATGSAVRLTGAIVGLIALQVLRRRLRATVTVLIATGTWKMLALPSVLATFVGIYFMMIAIRNCPPPVAGAVLSTTPITILPFAHYLRGERISTGVILATGVAVAGVALISAALAG